MHGSIARARDGDRAATAALVESLRPRIERMAAYYARCCGEEAEDLLQEAWLGLLEALPAVDLSIGSPQQYLIQRARWRMLDAVRRSRAQRAPEDGSSVEEAAADDGALAAACAREFAGQLKESQRAVLDCLLAGYTWREAGAALGCTSANIAYHVRQIQRRYLDWSGAQR